MVVVEFEGRIWMKARNVEVANEELQEILKRLANKIPQDVFGKKGIHDYDFPPSTKVVKE